MKIRLIETGYESLTGMFGEVEFVDGVSVHDVSPVQARFLASIVRIENIDGTDPGENARFQSAFNLEAQSFQLPTLAELEAAGKPAEVGQAQEAQVQAQVAEQYTQESLEAIADKGGIAGLREVADPLGVKGTSIAKLIEGILAAQAPAAPAAATLPEGQPDVVTTEQAEVPQE